MDNGHKISALEANSYKLNLFITDTLGQGVDNIFAVYVPFPVSSSTNIDTLSGSDTNTKTCLSRSISFCSKIRMYSM